MELVSERESFVIAFSAMELLPEESSLVGKGKSISVEKTLPIVCNALFERLSRALNKRPLTIPWTISIGEMH